MNKVQVFLISVIVASTFTACRHAESNSSMKGLTDVISAKDNGDGTYTVTCADARSEVVSQEQYMNDEVCRTQFCSRTDGKKVPVGQMEEGGEFSYKIGRADPPDQCQNHAHRQQRKCMGQDTWEAFTNYPGYDFGQCTGGCVFKASAYFDSPEMIISLKAGEAVSFPTNWGWACAEQKVENLGTFGFVVFLGKGTVTCEGNDILKQDLQVCMEWSPCSKDTTPPLKVNANCSIKEEARKMFPTDK